MRIVLRRAKEKQASARPAIRRIFSLAQALPDHTGDPARPEQADVGDVDGPVAVPQRWSEVVCDRGIYHLLRDVLDLGAVASDDNLHDVERPGQRCSAATRAREIDYELTVEPRAAAKTPQVMVMAKNSFVRWYQRGYLRRGNWRRLCRRSGPPLSARCSGERRAKSGCSDSQKEVGTVEACDGNAEHDGRDLHVDNVVVVEMCRREAVLDMILQVLVCSSQERPPGQICQAAPDPAKLREK